MLLLHIGLSKTECLFCVSSIKQAFAILRNSHEGMCLRCYRVRDEARQLLHRIRHHPRFGVVKFQMQVRTRGMASITTNGYDIATFDRKLFCRENQRQCIA